MKKKLVKVIVDLLCTYNLLHYLVKITILTNFPSLEVKIVRYFKRKGMVELLPKVGFAKFVISEKESISLDSSDLLKLIEFDKYKVIDNELITELASIIVSNEPRSVRNLDGEELIALNRLFCKPTYMSICKIALDNYYQGLVHTKAARAYYYTYIQKYEKALDEYLSIEGTNFFSYSHTVFILAITGRAKEIPRILSNCPKRILRRTVETTANKCSSLLRKGDINLEECIAALNILKEYDYNACKNLIISICFHKKSFSSVIILKNRIFSNNKLAHVTGIEYIFSITEIEGIEKAYAEAKTTTRILAASRSYRILWRYLLLLASIFRKQDVANLLEREQVEKCHNIAKGLNQIYLFNLIYGTDKSLINSIHNRFEGGRKYLGNTYGDKNVFKFVSVKNINYAYIMSSCYDEYSINDLILCEERFLDVFKNSFPNKKFISITRPTEDNSLSIHKWYGYDVMREIALCERIETQKLSYAVIEKNRKTGWLNGGVYKGSVIDQKKINVGISFGSGLVTGFRSAYNIPFDVVSHFDREKYNLINLDFHLESDFVLGLGLQQPDFDLKNDMQSLGNLISALDVLVCIPNNIMDAGAAYGKLTIVYDPFGRTSYWQYKDTDEYVFGSKVFLYQKRFDDSEERNVSFVREVCGRLNDEL